MGFRGNNERTFAEYVELDIAVNDDSPNAYIYKRLDSETNKPVSERTWYVGIPIPNKGNGKRLSLRTSDLSNAKKKALQKVVNIISAQFTFIDFDKMISSRVLDTAEETIQLETWEVICYIVKRV